MGRRDKIDQFLRDIENKKPCYVDTLSDFDVNEIPEVKELLKGFRIVNFTVIRDNETTRLADGSIKNKGGNKLLGFNYTLKIL
jgi:hypothetical protein